MLQPLRYLGYEEHREDDRSKDVEHTTKHSPVRIELISEQNSTSYHDDDDDGGDVDDKGHIFCIVERLDLDLSRSECQEDGNQLSQENVDHEGNDPDDIAGTFTDQRVAVLENVVFLQYKVSIA